MKNKVTKEEFEFEEDVRDFTGLIFHCPNCDNVFHLHIAEVKVKEKKKPDYNLIYEEEK
jgi:predicted HNH restriction endonuclease